MVETLTQSINKLKELTVELAEEIRDESDGLLKFVGTIFDYIEGTCIEVVTTDYELLYISPWTKKKMHEVNIEVSDRGLCFERIWGMSSPCSWCPVARAVRERKILHINKAEIAVPLTNGTDVEYCVTVIPLVYNGVSGAIVLTNIEGE